MRRLAGLPKNALSQKLCLRLVNRQFQSTGSRQRHFLARSDAEHRTLNWVTLAVFAFFDGGRGRNRDKVANSSLRSLQVANTSTDASGGREEQLFCLPSAQSQISLLADGVAARNPLSQNSTKTLSLAGAAVSLYPFLPTSLILATGSQLTQSKLTSGECEVGPVLLVSGAISSTWRAFFTLIEFRGAVSLIS